MEFFVRELVGRHSVEGVQNVSGAEPRRGARSGGRDLFDDPRVVYVNRNEHMLIELEWKLDVSASDSHNASVRSFANMNRTVATVSQPARARTERRALEALRKARGFAITLMSWAAIA